MTVFVLFVPPVCHHLVCFLPILHPSIVSTTVHQSAEGPIDVIVPRKCQPNCIAAPSVFCIRLNYRHLLYSSCIASVLFIVSLPPSVPASPPTPTRRFFAFRAAS